MRRTVPPSAEIEEQIDRLLAVGVGENPRESLSGTNRRCVLAESRTILGLAQIVDPEVCRTGCSRPSTVAMAIVLAIIDKCVVLNRIDQGDHPEAVAAVVAARSVLDRVSLGAPIEDDSVAAIMLHFVTTQ